MIRIIKTIITFSSLSIALNSLAAPMSPEAAQALQQLHQLQQQLPSSKAMVPQPVTTTTTTGPAGSLSVTKPGGTLPLPEPVLGAGTVEAIPPTPNTQDNIVASVPPPPGTVTSTVVTTQPGVVTTVSEQAPVMPPPRAKMVNPEASDLFKSSNPELDETAFKSVTGKMFPLTPEQILRLREMYNIQEFAKVSSPSAPPKPIATSKIVNLSPGSTPPVVRLAQGFVSSVVFLDSTGAPWPIEAYDLGDPKSFNIQWDRTSNTLMIQSNKLYTYGNLAVRLIGLNTPVMLTLIPGQKAVDYRVDMRVRGYGPNAKMPSMGVGLPLGANPELLRILDGIAPPGFLRLKVVGGDAEAWVKGSKLYVRTHLTILSPGWVATMSSADGTHAYEMPRSPLLLVSWRGKIMQLKLEGL